MMNKEFIQECISQQNQGKGSLLGLELLRDVLLPDLLDGQQDIMYWAGKKLARKMLLAKDEDLPVFFELVGWGDLQRTKSKRGQQTFSLSGDNVRLRLKNFKKAEFQLECGFLAETVQLQSGFVTEGLVSDINHHKGIVELTIQVDHRDPIDYIPGEDVEMLNLE